MQHVVEIDVANAEAELAADQLWALGVIAIEERAAGDGVTLAVGVPANDVERVINALPPEWHGRVVDVDDGCWADAWKRWASDVRVGERVRVHPAWIPEGDVTEGEIVIRLDPGRTFGSGTHPTTRLVLAELEARIRPGDRVLDVGTGSGVLAVGAALLGAGRVTAVDIEPEAVRTTVENAGRNGVTRTVHAILGDVTATDGVYDIVVVNIGASDIVAAGPDLAARTAPGGVLIAAGFLTDRSPAVAAAFPGLRVEAEAIDGPWSALVLRNGATS